MSVNAREAAALALERFRKSGMRSENALSSVLNAYKLEARDSSLAARLFYTVIQNLYYIDAVISEFSSTPIKEIHAKVLDILRICCSQILYFDRVPDFSAVNEAVLQCKKVQPKAAGFVNAICRKISDNKNNFPFFGNTDCEKLSIKYSHPLWLVKKLNEYMSLDELEKLLDANNAIPPVYLHYNPLKCSASDIEKSLDVFKHPYLDGCFCTDNFGKLAESTEFKNGLFYVQDPAAKMSVIAASPESGNTVVDVCAAPGGKSIAAAMMMNNNGRVFSFDIGEKKIPKILEAAERLGIDIIKAEKADGRVFISELESKADVVIADVPCSGFGVIRKKPEIRYKDYSDVSNLPEIQLSILKNASRYVKVGGTLLYSTCTVLREENENVVNAFLSIQDNFLSEDFEIPAGSSKDGMMTLYPHIHGTDGFFICKLRRVK